MDSRAQSDPPTLIPARMLNEWAYCARLGMLMWSHREFAHNAETVEGLAVHRRADVPTRDLPPADVLDEAVGPRRSLWHSSEREGLTAKMDVVEVQGGMVEPVDYKRGSPPSDHPDGAWEPERVQLCAQALVLRDNGYRCERGWLYFVKSRQRVEVRFDDELVNRTRELAAAFRASAGHDQLPPPLRDSPKCPRCSLVGICLPDETSHLGAEHAAAPHSEPRQLLAPRDDGLPVYVSEQGSRVGLRDGRLRVTKGRSCPPLAEARLREVNSLNVFGYVQVTTQAQRALMDQGTPICWFSTGGWFSGLTHGHPHKNVALRQAQFAAAADDDRRMPIARAIVRSKIRNQRTLLRRNHRQRDDSELQAALDEMKRLSMRAERAPTTPDLMGLEGMAARLYFRHFTAMFADPAEAAFEFEKRNRRPPRDPVNCLLSYAYALLARDLTSLCLAAGFDPYLGFLHAPRYGRPALALDLMEEARPLIADSVVLQAINNGEVTTASFLHRADGCVLTAHGRKAFLSTYERRMDQLLTHPIFGYRATWRRILDIQCRLLGRHLLGEIPAYLPIETR